MKILCRIHHMQHRGLWPILLAMVLIGGSGTPASAESYCQIEKAALWSMDDPARPYYETKKQIAHEPCTLGTNPDCPALIQAGRFGSALQFDDTSGLSIERNGVFEWRGDDSFAVEFWMKRDGQPMNNGRNEVIVGRDDPSTEMHWWVGVNWRGVATAYLKNRQGHIKSVKGNKLLTDNTWHHVVFVRDAQRFEIRIYVDGELEDRATVTYDGDDAFSSDQVKLNIGWIDMSYQYHYLGAVDEIALFQMALPEWYIREQFHAEERYGAPCK